MHDPFATRRVLSLAAALFVAFAAWGAGPAHGVTVVVPNALDDVEGDTNYGAPFHCAGSGFYSMRYQQVFRGNELAGLAGAPITEIRFRRDGSTAPGFSATTLAGVTVRLSSTVAAPDALSTTFAANAGADATTVFSGNLTLASPAGGGVPRPFDIRLPLQTPFTFDPSGGKNLLLDVTVPVCNTTNPFDAADIGVDPVSSIWAGSSSATMATAVSTVGMVAQFLTTPADAVLPLQGGRFEVAVAWETGAGATGSGHAANLTDDSGTFWFFGPENVELIVKVVDACVAPFDAFWFFAAGLTDVEVTITVTDTQSGQVNTYLNPQGRPFQPVQDTRAFETCP